MTTKSKEQTEAEILKEVMLPIIEKHGLDKGGKVLTAVGEVLTQISKWPDDIKESCMEELERILELAKSKAAKS